MDANQIKEDLRHAKQLLILKEAEVQIASEQLDRALIEYKDVQGQIEQLQSSLWGCKAQGVTV